jgi:hypothetical protein
VIISCYDVGMSDDLATIATYRFAPKAEIARLLLEQEGIEAFVADSNVVTTDWFLGNAIGFVKLQVRRSQLEAASQVLEANSQVLDAAPREDALARDTNDDDDAEDSNCLACGEPMADDADQCSACGWSYDAEGDEDEV